MLALVIGLSAPLPNTTLILPAASTRSVCAVAVAVPLCLDAHVKAAMTGWSKEVAEREAVITTLSLALEWEGVWVIVTRYSRDMDWPAGITGGARLGVAVVFEESARAGPEIWDQRNVRSAGLMPGVSWEADRVTETPLRTVWSVPADTCRFTGPVGVLVGAVDDVEVAGGGQFATNGVGAVWPGQGLS